MFPLDRAAAQYIAVTGRLSSGTSKLATEDVVCLGVITTSLWCDGGYLSWLTARSSHGIASCIRN